MVRPCIEPLIDALFDDVTEESECPFIKEICDAFEQDSPWPRQLFESGEAARKLNHVAFAAFCEVLDQQQDLEDQLYLQKLRGLTDEGKGEGSTGKLQGEGKGKEKVDDMGKADEGKGKGKLDDLEKGEGKGRGKVDDLGRGQGEGDLEKGVIGVDEMMKAEEKIGPFDSCNRRGKGRKRGCSKKGKLFRVKEDELWAREIVCALPMAAAGGPFEPPKQSWWHKAQLVDGKKVKRVMPKRGCVAGASGVAGGVIEISSSSSSSGEESDDDSSDGDSSGEEGIVLQLPDVVNGVDVSNWNPLFRIFMEFMGGTPGGN